jgi:hypothetical protein
MKFSCHFLLSPPVTSELNYRKVLSAVSGLELYSHDTDYAENTSHVIAKHCWCVMSLRMRKLHRHKGNTAAVFLYNATAYEEVCLPSHFLETCCIAQIFFCCLRILLSNGCFYGSTVLALSKYAAVSTVRRSQYGCFRAMRFFFILFSLSVLYVSCPGLFHFRINLSKYAYFSDIQ